MMMIQEFSMPLKLMRIGMNEFDHLIGILVLLKRQRERPERGLEPRESLTAFSIKLK